MIACVICSQRMLVVTNSHLRRHNQTPAEYVKRFGSSLSSPEARLNKRKFKGDWAAVGLGEKPDSVIARELGLDRKTVEQARKKRRIPTFGGLILTQEGKPCRSIYEAMYDACLHGLAIPHEHEVAVPGMAYIADFRVGDTLVEIAGMLGFNRYADKSQRKRDAYQRAAINCTWLNPADVEALYSNCTLPLRFRGLRSCLDCGVQTHDLVKQVCRACYMKRWHAAGQVQTACVRCGHLYRQRESDHQRFCSRSCYAKSLELDWPTWDWIDEQLKVVPARRLAHRLGVKESTLYRRLARRRVRSSH